MAGVTARFPAKSRILVGGDREVKFPSEKVSLHDMFFGFLEEGEESSESSCSTDSGGRYSDDAGDEEEQDENANSAEESKAFWETQHQLLNATLSRTSSVESRIRQAVKDASRESQMAGNVCVCRNPIPGGCRSCLRRDISERLRNAGFNCAICKSKWRSSPEIPSGEHTYLDVVEQSSKKGQIRVVIELNFRAEFEMARASDEYNRLINRLPEVLVGKGERLRSLVKILCSAAKKCMKENKMHMGPWRKHKYMQAKWFGTCERIAPAPLFSTTFSDRPPKPPKASMLTFDLLENLPTLQPKAVAVV
ncbi:uncharacterized protein LOC122093424 [Macadamia integrifolia]|uniref:uncharacterized protein LOC122093424 n=1 Tax=Macadamia integrifolia TaxID=60698 RepID=UPI001C528A6C|nr:uncharacterized protein LOC122093424 [Macadamia integrifolia]